MQINFIYFYKHSIKIEIQGLKRETNQTKIINDTPIYHTQEIRFEEKGKPVMDQELTN